jgi:hypothetical protein
LVTSLIAHGDRIGWRSLTHLSSLQGLGDLSKYVLQLWQGRTKYRSYLSVEYLRSAALPAFLYYHHPCADDWMVTRNASSYMSISPVAWSHNTTKAIRRWLLPKWCLRSPWRGCCGTLVILHSDIAVFNKLTSIFLSLNNLLRQVA